MVSIKNARRDSINSSNSNNKFYYDNEDDRMGDEDRRPHRVERGESRRHYYRDEDYDPIPTVNKSKTSTFRFLLNLLFFSFILLIAYLALFPSNNIFDLNYKDPEVKEKLLRRLESGKGYLMEKIGEGSKYFNESYSKIMGKGAKSSEDEDGIGSEEFEECVNTVED